MTIVQWLLLPAFIHAGWIYLVAVRMGSAKRGAVRAGRVTLFDVAVDNSRWPDDVRKITNNYNNQFELPVLFYAILPLLILLVKVDWPQVALAWTFLASRILHSVIHMGSNVILRRGSAFLVGFAAVGLMWVWFGLRLYVIG